MSKKNKNTRKDRVKKEEKKVESQVLLKLLKASVSLLEEEGEEPNSDEVSGQKAYLAWKKFLLEILSFLVKKSALIISSNNSGNRGNGANGQSILNSKARFYTVGSILQHPANPPTQPDQPPPLSRYKLPICVPYIRLSGSWLEKYGFGIGKKFEIYPEKNQLILKEATFARNLLEGTKKTEGEMSNG